jgi:hypothetical protein
VRISNPKEYERRLTGPAERQDVTVVEVMGKENFARSFRGLHDLGIVSPREAKVTAMTTGMSGLGEKPSNQTGEIHVQQKLHGLGHFDELQDSLSHCPGRIA